MDIEDFYAGDARRRDGQDISYGTGWRAADADHQVFDLFWNDGSCELYLMAKPVVNPLVGYAGYALRDDIREIEWAVHRIVGVAEQLIHPRHIQAKTGEVSEAHPKEALTEELQVEVLAVIGTQGEVDEALEGWQSAIGEPDGVAWLRARLADRT